MSKRKGILFAKIGATVLTMVLSSAMTVFAELTPERRQEMVWELTAFYESSGMDSTTMEQVVRSMDTMSDSELENMYDQLIGLSPEDEAALEAELKTLEEELDAWDAESGEALDGMLDEELSDISLSDSGLGGIMSSITSNALFQQEIKPETVRYDSANGLYLMDFPDGSTIISNVRNGITTNNHVYLTLPAKASYTITKDGGPYTYVRGEAIREDGIYRVVYSLSYDREVVDEDSISTATYTERVSGSYEFFFRIVTRPTNRLNFFNLPEYSRFESISCNGEPMEFDPAATFWHLDTNGEYEFVIQDTEFSNVNTVTNITYDTVPPFLTVAGPDDEGNSYTDVVVQKQDEDSYLTCYLDRVAFTPSSYVFSQPGYYIIQSTDQAGNYIAYTFRRMYTMDSTGILSIAALAALAIGILGYCIWLRKHMRVR